MNIIKLITRASYYIKLIKEIVTDLDDCAATIASRVGAEDNEIGQKLHKIKTLLSKINL